MSDIALNRRCNGMTVSHIFISYSKFNKTYAYQAVIKAEKRAREQAAWEAGHDKRDGLAAWYQPLRRFSPVTDILPAPFEWCPVPAGSFKCGEKGQDDNPTRTLTLPAFEIAKYLITWEQFAVFLDADDGFRRDDWWAGLAVEAEHRAQPGEQRFQMAGHPRERVSWYDAMAFCRWFSYRLGGSYSIEHPNRWAVRLPTEWEWEKAARGTDGLAYPYGDQFDVKKSNTRESGIGQTTPVTAYPEGASPCGALDMSGNVWEWTLGTYEKSADDADNVEIASALQRMVRGGSWAFDQGYARPAYRLSDDPFLRSIDVGFRVVRLPSR
jgi:formylglycine-generating enzyme required for sulfatase activity